MVATKDFVAISYARNHYGFDEKKVRILIEQNILESVDHNGKTLLSKDSLDKHAEYEKDIKENFVPVGEFFEILGYNKQGYTSPAAKETFAQLEELDLIETVKLDGWKIQFNNIWVSKVSVEKLKETLKTEYIDYHSALQVFNWKDHDLHYRIKKYDIPSIRLLTRYYPRKALEDVVLEGYISTNEASNITGLSMPLIKRYGAESIFEGVVVTDGRKMIPEKEAERIKQDLLYLRENYYTSAEAIEYLNLATTASLTVIPSIICPPHARSFASKSQRLYLKEDIHAYFNERIGANQKRFKKGAPSDAINYFKLCIEEQEINLDPETMKLFTNYVIRELSLSEASDKTKLSYADTFLSLAKTIAAFGVNKPINLMSTIEASELLTSESRVTAKWYLYDFLGYCSENTICKFELRRIKKPSKQGLSSKEVEIYSFDEFMDIYRHATYIDKHVKQAVENWKYASSWLYVLMHLSNAWRHSDVIEIPPIYPEAIQVNSLEWFNDNDLIFLQGQKIINQLSNFELVISKTGMKRHFFCNTDLVVPMATAMTICELHRRNENLPFLINTHSKKGVIPDSTLKMFFSGNKNFAPDFKFRSLKMNRSLMTHLFYSIQKREGKGNSAFELVQRLRNHATEITKDYIFISDQDVGEVSRSLFDRGEFGFIYDQLIDVLTLEESSSSDTTERTKQIVHLKQYWDPQLVESFSGFLQNIEAEKLSVINQIKSLKPEEAFDRIRNIYLEQMPSKMQHIQCFSYPECHKPSKDFNCANCIYAIPNIYALNALSQNIQSSVDAYKNAAIDGVKKKNYISLQRSLPLLMQATEEFGESFVWSFFENGEQGFEANLSEIEGGD